MRRISNRAFLAAGIGLSALLAGVLSYYASSSPDGLEKVGEDVGFIESAKDSAASGSTFADYAVAGIENARLSNGLAGLVGIIVMAALAFGLFRWLGRGRDH